MGVRACRSSRGTNAWSEAGLDSVSVAGTRVLGDLAPLLLEQFHPVVDRDLSHVMSTVVKHLRKSLDSSGPEEIRDLGIRQLRELFGQALVPPSLMTGSLSVSVLKGPPSEVNRARHDVLSRHAARLPRFVVDPARAMGVPTTLPEDRSQIVHEHDGASTAHAAVVADVECGSRTGERILGRLIVRILNERIEQLEGVDFRSCGSP